MTGIGAGWASGELPPWMEQPPGFDEADAADRARLLTAILDERFGPLAATTAERPIPAAVVFARRRAVLERALRSTHTPAADSDRRAA